MTKMTYAVAIDNAIAALRAYESTELGVKDESIEKLKALKVQLAKRGSGKHGMTKTQKENEVLKDKVAEILANGGASATEIANEMGVSCQKVSALLKQMIEAERVAKVKEGKAIRFELL